MHRPLRQFVLSLALSASLGLASHGAYPAPPGDDEPEHADRTPGQVLDDSAITAKVKAQLIGDPVTKARHIDVDTHGGVVTLAGKVNTASEQSRAIEIARNTEGVHSVTDKLSVGRR